MQDGCSVCMLLPLVLVSVIPVTYEWMTEVALQIVSELNQMKTCCWDE